MRTAKNAKIADAPKGNYSVAAFLRYFQSQPVSLISGLLTLVVFSSGPAFASEPLEFKGVYIGMAISTATFSERLVAPSPASPKNVPPEFAERIAKLRQSIEETNAIKCAPGINGAQMCHGYTSIVGSNAPIDGLIDSQGILQRILITFPSDIFGEVEKGLREKFGPPKSDNLETIQNGIGAKFENKVLIWTDDAGNILRISRYEGTVKEGTFRLLTKAEVERAAVVARSRSKDL